MRVDWVVGACGFYGVLAISLVVLAGYFLLAVAGLLARLLFWIRILWGRATQLQGRTRSSMAIDLLLPAFSISLSPFPLHIPPYLPVLNKGPHNPLYHINSKSKKEDEFQEKKYESPKDKEYL